jgi:hypothetical protein
MTVVSLAFGLEVVSANRAIPKDAQAIIGYETAGCPNRV